MARRVVMAMAGVVLAVLAGMLAYRSRHFLFPPDDRRAAQPDDRISMLPAGPPIRFLSPQPIGKSFSAKERPLVAHVTTVDLDGDGLMDVVACDVAANQVVWIRRSPPGTFTETPIGAEVRAPAHAEPVDLDGDGDLDLVVASLGVMFPSNAKIGSVIVLENDGHGRFINRWTSRRVIFEPRWNWIPATRMPTRTWGPRWRSKACSTRRSAISTRPCGSIRIMPRPARTARPS